MLDVADKTAQQEKLEKRIREYIAWRIDMAKPPAKATPEAKQEDTHSQAEQTAQSKQASAQPETQPAAQAAQPEETHSEEDAAERALFGEDEPALSASTEVKTEIVDDPQPQTQTQPQSDRPADLAAQLFPPDSPTRRPPPLFGSPSRSRSRFSESQPPPKRPNLGEIAQLVDDLVRNREEKVAIAVGAYNNVGAVAHVTNLTTDRQAYPSPRLGA